MLGNLGAQKLRGVTVTHILIFKRANRLSSVAESEFLQCSLNKPTGKREFKGFLRVGLRLNHTLLTLLDPP